jgi:diguanylate cyclase (GGDEF)-like protein
MFKFNESNQYVGLDGSLILGFVQLLFLLHYIIMTIKLRSKVDRKIYSNIIILSVMPLFSTVLQNVFFGSVFVMPSLAYICFYTFLIIEREEMIKDPLTNLSLRRHLESRMTFLQKKNIPYTLILIDLDKFKSINDSHGHNKGDEVLRTFSDILLLSIHKVDSVYRYAGDEFVILFESHDLIVFDSIMSKIKINLKTFNKSSDIDIKLSFSYGIINVDPKDQLDISEIVSLVDQGMYENKRKKQ